MLMNFETTKTAPINETPINEMQQDKRPNTPASEDKEWIRPYQQPPRDPSPSGASVVSEELPNHVYGDLCSYWRSHSHFHSRVRIFEGFAMDGPFPAITSIQFKEDPQTGLTRKYSEELNKAIRDFKGKICQIHDRNLKHLATNELIKINTLTTKATEIYDESVVQNALKGARAHALNKAREIKRLKNQSRNRTSQTSREPQKRIRSPSRGRSRERRQQNK